MLRISSLVLLLVLAGAGAHGGDGSLDQIGAAVQAGIDKGELPGAVVVVLKGDRIVLRQAYGQRVRQPEPTLMTEDTVFDLASLTKPIVTALGILLLMEEGKLSIDDLLARHLPAFARKETDGITLVQLLVHTSGFIADNPLADYQQGPEEAWRRLFALKPLTTPGTRFTYSDVNYLLLGAVIEKVSGQRLDEFARRRIFEPLGMKETGYLPGPELRRRAAPTERRDGRWLAGEVHDPRSAALGGVAGHAGLFSTADDLAVFARMLLAGGKHEGRVFLRPETLRLYTQGRDVPTTKGPGLRTCGWDMQTSYSSNRGELFPKGISYGHTGFTGTSLWVDPQSKSAVIFLSNRVHPDGKGNVTRLRGEVATIAARALLNTQR
jgi:CubicO group peptidase (beta-lactamase class C family)